MDSGRPMKNTCICGMRRDNIPETEIEQQPEHEERRRQLNADAKRRPNDAGHMLRRVSQQRQFSRLKNRVAVVHRRDHQMMQIGGEDERYAEHRQEISDQNPLLVLRWIDGGDKSKAKLLGNDRARDLEGGNRGVLPSAPARRR